MPSKDCPVSYRGYPSWNRHCEVQDWDWCSVCNVFLHLIRPSSHRRLFPWNFPGERSWSWWQRPSSTTWERFLPSYHWSRPCLGGNRTKIYWARGTSSSPPQSASRCGWGCWRYHGYPRRLPCRMGLQYTPWSTRPRLRGKVFAVIDWRRYCGWLNCIGVLFQRIWSTRLWLIYGLSFLLHRQFRFSWLLGSTMVFSHRLLLVLIFSSRYWVHSWPR